MTVALPIDPAPIVITGAGRNIGAHMAHRFLDEGFAVIAHYRTPTVATNELAARGALLVQGEFANTTTILAIADTIRRQAPRLRALIHNASAFAPTADDAPNAADQFQAFFEVHMLAPYLLNTQLGAHIRAEGGPGDIVHITDIYADHPSPHYDIYCATKAGLQNLSASFARSLAPDVKVNTIQPGPISFENWISDAQRTAMLANTPLGRPGSADNIHQAVCAVLDNDYQTGAVITVDGGRRLGR